MRIFWIIAFSLLFGAGARASGQAPAVNSDLGCSATGQTLQYNGTPTLACAAPAAINAGPGIAVTGQTVGTTYVPVVISASTTTPIVTGYAAQRVSLTSTTGVPLTLAQAGSTGFPAGWSVTLVNDGTGGTAGSVSITPTTSSICGQTSTTWSALGVSLTITSDGTNYSCEWGGQPNGAGSSVFTNTNTTTGGTVMVGRSDSTLGNGAVLGTIQYTGANSTGAAITYGQIQCDAATATAGSEIGQCYVTVLTGGVQTKVATFNSTVLQAPLGLSVGTTGGTGSSVITTARDIIVRHIINSTGTAPAIAAGAGAGSATPTFTTGAQDTSFEVNLTGAGVPSASAVIATITMGTTSTNKPVCVLSNNNVNAQISGAYLSIGGSSPWLLTINSGATPLSTLFYLWDVICIAK